MLAETLDRLAVRLDPALLLGDLGFEPDDYQRRVLRSRARRMLILCHRQAGKSTATAGLALHTALYDAPALVLLISRSQRQADELFRKVQGFYRSLGEPVASVTDRADTLALVNGSRVVSLPNSANTIVGFSGPKLVIVDEAARVPDEVFLAVSPMLLVSGGRMVALSTPYGRRGFFYESWENGGHDWERIRFRASDNPRLDRAWLAEERRVIGERHYLQDYECMFMDTIDQVFSGDAIEAAFRTDEEPLVVEGWCS